MNKAMFFTGLGILLLQTFGIVLYTLKDYFSLNELLAGALYSISILVGLGLLIGGIFSE